MTLITPGAACYTGEPRRLSQRPIGNHL